MFRGASTLFNPTSSSAHLRQQARRDRHFDHLLTCQQAALYYSTSTARRNLGAHRPHHSAVRAQGLYRELASYSRIERFTRALLGGCRSSIVTTSRVHTFTQLQQPRLNLQYLARPHLDLCPVTEIGSEYEVHSRAARGAQAIAAGKEARWLAVDPAMDGRACRPEQQ